MTAHPARRIDKPAGANGQFGRIGGPGRSTHADRRQPFQSRARLGRTRAESAIIPVWPRIPAADGSGW
jgi:hypothetical protein